LTGGIQLYATSVDGKMWVPVDSTSCAWLLTENNLMVHIWYANEQKITELLKLIILYPQTDPNGEK
jgi:hypothetical protein